MKRKELIEHAGSMGLYVATWSPGDGYTRYRVGKARNEYERDYSAMPHPLFTGTKAELAIYLRGYRDGNEPPQTLGSYVGQEEV